MPWLLTDSRFVSARARRVPTLLDIFKMQRLPDARFSPCSGSLRRKACGLISAAILTFGAGSLEAQNPTLSDLDRGLQLCNGVAGSGLDAQIDGCTIIINSRAATPRSLAIAYNNRGNAHYRMGQHDLAIQDYNRAVEIDPGHASAFNNRGVVYRKKGEYERAIADFDLSILINPNYAGAFGNRADTYRAMRDFGRAIRDFDEAIRIQPTLNGLSNGRCWVRAILGDLISALADCDQALQLEPNVAAVRHRPMAASLDLSHLYCRSGSEPIAYGMPYCAN